MWLNKPRATTVSLKICIRCISRKPDPKIPGTCSFRVNAQSQRLHLQTEIVTGSCVSTHTAIRKHPKPPAHRNPCCCSECNLTLCLAIQFLQYHRLPGPKNPWCFDGLELGCQVFTCYWSLPNHCSAFRPATFQTQRRLKEVPRSKFEVSNQVPVKFPDCPVHVAAQNMACQTPCQQHLEQDCNGCFVLPSCSTGYAAMLWNMRQRILPTSWCKWPQVKPCPKTSYIETMHLLMKLSICPFESILTGIIENLSIAILIARAPLPPHAQL